jgi:DNA segregation ATPase FtsK/SpoIIIE, S-DNA-T family
MLAVKRKAIFKDMFNGSRNLERMLNNSGILSRVSDVENGQETRRYVIELPADLRAQRIFDLSDDIAASMGVSGIHIDAPISKKIIVSITVPNNLG